MNPMLSLVRNAAQKAGRSANGIQLFYHSKNSFSRNSAVFPQKIKAPPKPLFVRVDITVGRIESARLRRSRRKSTAPPRGRQLDDPPFPGAKHPCNTLSGEPRRLRRMGAFHTFLCNSIKSTIDYRPVSWYNGKQTMKGGYLCPKKKIWQNAP